MKIVALAVLFAIMQASPPVPRKAAEDTAAARNSVQGQAKSNETNPSQPAPVADAKSTSDNDAARNEQKTENTQQSVVVSKLPSVTVVATDKTWADWILWGCNVLLVPITLLIAITAVIQASAARLNAQALINAERPWVMVQVRETAVPDGKGVFDRRSFQFIMFNYGKSPAHILSVKGPKIEFLNDPEKDLASVPDYGIWDWDRKFLAPRDDIKIGNAIYPFKAKLEKSGESAARGERLNGSELVTYGLIEYADGMSETLYKTAFCYHHVKGQPSESGGHFIICGPGIYNEYT